MEIREGYRVLLPCSSTTTLAAMTMEVPLDPGEVEALEVYVAHKWIHCWHNLSALEHIAERRWGSGCLQMDSTVSLMQLSGEGDKCGTVKEYPLQGRYPPQQTTWKPCLRSWREMWLAPTVTVFHGSAWGDCCGRHKVGFEVWRPGAEEQNRQWTGRNCIARLPGTSSKKELGNIHSMCLPGLCSVLYQVMQYWMCLKVNRPDTLVTKVNWLTNTCEHTERLHHTSCKKWVGNAGAKVLGFAMMLSTMKDVLQQL